MTHEYMKSEEVAAIREFYQTLPLDLDSSVLAVRGDFLRLIDDWQALMKENQWLRDELEMSQAEGDVRKCWQEKLQARTIELYEREKKLVKALKTIAAYTTDRITADCARGTLKDLGYGEGGTE